MSSPIASRWVRGTSRRPDRPSVREVCLVGEVRRPGPEADAAGPLLLRSGRAYLVASEQGPIDPDPRRYVHLVVAPGFTRV